MRLPEAEGKSCLEEVTMTEAMTSIERNSQANQPAQPKIVHVQLSIISSILTLVDRKYNFKIKPK